MKELFARASTYVKEMVCNEYIQNVYSELFTFGRLARDPNGVQSLASYYGLSMNEPGFLFSFISKLDERFRTDQIESRCADAVRQTLDEFFFRAFGNDYNLTVSASGEEVVQFIRKNSTVWERLSGYFMASLASTMFLREAERKTPGATFAVKRELERRTNELLASYVALSEGRRTNYGRLLQHIREDWDWFKSEMTK